MIVPPEMAAIGLKRAENENLILTEVDGPLAAEKNHFDADSGEWLMNVRYSPEQVLLKESVARAVERLGPATVADLDDEARSARLDSAVDESGWRELRNASGEASSPWASAVEVCIIAEALAHGRADVAFVGPTLAAELRRLAGAEPADGLETVVLTPDLAALAIVDAPGVAIDAHGEVDGLVLCSDGDGWALSSVRIDGRGGGVDLTRPLKPVGAGVAVPIPAQRSLDAEALDLWSALALAVTTADLVGTMSGVIDVTVAYAAERRQYGRPIGSFQAVQHMLADALVHLEGSRSSGLYAAWAVDHLPASEALAAAAAAKAYASRAVREVCETSIQVHGGIGNTWECIAHVHLRRALLSTDIGGGVGPNLARVLTHAGIGGD